MTENKRFHYDCALEKIYDYDTCEDGIVESLDCFDACELLNELNDENEQLQLQMLRLYNYFEDYFENTMSPESFSEMWDIVKESEKWEKR